MNRRQFTKLFGAGAAALVIGGTTAAISMKEPPQVSVTFDDFVLNDVPAMTAEARNRGILDALRTHGVKAAAFVQGRNVEAEARRRLLDQWDREGHMIANHSYSHYEYHETSFEKFSADVLRGEAVIKDYKNFKKYFRFPYLKEGESVEKRDRMRAFLKANGYRNGHVTIDASDWYVNQRMLQRLTENPKAPTAPYRDYYLDHLWERSVFYDDLSKKVLGRSVKHTLLLHHNVLNGMFLGDVLQMFKRKGWRLIDAEDAFADPVFKAEPKVVPAGESVIWALAKESKKFEHLLRYPAEDGEYEKRRMDQLGL